MTTKLFSLIVMVILGASSFLSTFAQDTIFCADLNQPEFENYDLFNQDLKSKKLIILGEMHYKASNPIIQAELFIHLNKEFGVRHLLIEFGHAEAYLYNRYLQTGSEWYLDHTSPGLGNSKEFYNSMKKLYKYNLELNKDKKLVVHGLDFEREPGLSATLYELLSNYTDPQVESLRDSIYERLDTIGLERDTKEYSHYLKGKIGELSLPNDENKRIIDKILNNESYFVNLSQRDKYMVKHFMELDTTQEAYLGKFGIAHTMLNAVNGFTALLNNMEQYKNNISVIQMYYPNSEENSPLNDLSDCPVFLFRPDTFDKKSNIYRFFNDRSQWVLVLKDQNRSTKRD
ncbi:hypothetical protein [Chondrinema litorale]|uniref:hypothetical protein n=1 Tax=Chondrinema litorale TaxID=2994555 RepID=UPI002542B71A|nr:hypothetical protein [Chondrinema litorale]UZR96803.1 hypothetical protein OQ292_24195 [Chondrinema litorale]